MKIFTERLCLTTRIEPQMALDYYIRNRTFLSEWESEREEAFFTLEMQRILLENDQSAKLNGQSYRFWIFEHGESDRVIGCVSIQNILRSIMQSCILGYKLDHAMVGKGYITEALRGVVTFVFSELTLHRIEAPIMPSNKPSIRVVEKLGFRYEGTTFKMMKVNGVWEDHERWSLLNPADESL
ncbi:GNAT family N-acetyltransferase [Jeotgalibacillus sp. R-1-5s-1]|uniref:GNAT family N-acetyltransferase n=1 Tax=Jeotgalibacillus sp. R-1-5s-1 TaxID=2555897 RepID=UPI00106C9CD8|nr:GNAT family protein [Jeotgalibacillus sp. R-1-5s-1]TFD94557.1 N-acetyltransferase [Jeotgalibacillus sp. R-1-5s-1]